MMYLVQEGDTLWGIAKKCLGSSKRYVDLVKFNGLKVATLYQGQILRLTDEGF